MSIKAIVVDDQPYARESLVSLLEEYCPDVQVVAVCNNGSEGLKAIAALQPQLVFLDVEMSKMNAFEMLAKINEIHFDLVFTASYDQYALKAIRFSAIDYLLKPIDKEELQQVIQKVLHRTIQTIPQQLEILMQKFRTPSRAINKIAMPTMEGLQMIPVASIISCEIDHESTILHLEDRQPITVLKTLNDIEELLEEYSFTRVDPSHLINLDKIQEYINGEESHVLMSDGSTVDISRGSEELLIKKLQPTRL